MARAQTNGHAKEQSVSDLTAQIDALREELGALTQSFAQESVQKAQAAKSTVKSAAEDTVAYASLHAEDLRNRGVDAAQDAQAQALDFMKKQPATAIGIAAGAGFLIGFLSSRR